MGKQQRFSRRDFLKFGAVGAAGAAAAGIVGCTPSGGATDEAKAASPAMDGAINSSDAVLKLTDGMPKWSFMIPPDPPDDQITETVENDIIVGGGMSGFTTAVSAAEQGAKVTLFSAASAPISRGGSNYAKNSKVMEDRASSRSIQCRSTITRCAASFAVDQQKWMRGYNESKRL
ncbi:MAG: twin-arginine translocation signal domain-containing protein [Adlercreutzia equolifaciens]